MNILVVSILGEVLDLAMILQQEGHDVRLHIRNKWNKDIGDGIVSKVSAWNKYISWADLLIFADSGFGNMPKKLRQKGMNAIGGTAITDRMGNDREFGVRIAQFSGIPVPKHTVFSNFTNAKQFLKKNPKKKFVFESIGPDRKGWTKILVPQTRDRVMEYLEYAMNGEGSFMLQEFVEGIEMGIGAWFNGSKFLKPMLPNFKFGNMGSVIIYKDKNKLFTETLHKASHVLAAEGYVGYINLNCIITEDGPYALDWTTRFGYPTLLMQDEIHKGDWGPFFMNLANASTPTFKTRKNNWCTGVAVVTLPWPVEVHSEKYRNLPIFMKGNANHIHFSDMKMKKDERVVAGSKGYIAIATGHGRDLETAMEYAHKRAGQVTVDGSYYRNDIGVRLLGQLPTIKRWGYLSK